jgi:hypothetical protein
MQAYPCHMGIVCMTEQLAKVKAAAASTGRSQGAVVRLLIDQMTLGATPDVQLVTVEAGDGAS